MCSPSELVKTSGSSSGSSLQSCGGDSCTTAIALAAGPTCGHPWRFLAGHFGGHSVTELANCPIKLMNFLVESGYQFTKRNAHCQVDLLLEGVLGVAAAAAAAVGLLLLFVSCWGGGRATSRSCCAELSAGTCVLIALRVEHAALRPSPLYER